MSLGRLEPGDIEKLADGLESEPVVWARVNAGFTGVGLNTSASGGPLLSPLLFQALPMKAIARHWIAWHDYRPEVVPASVLDDLVSMPQEESGHRDFEALCHRFPVLYDEVQSGIARHLTALTENSDDPVSEDLAVSFLSGPCDLGRLSLIFGSADMTGVELGPIPKLVPSSYWEAVVQGLGMIGRCLRPLMTPDEMMELSPALMDEEEEDLDAVLAWLRANGRSTDDEGAVMEALNEVEPFVIECFWSFESAMERRQIADDVRQRWQSASICSSVSEFAALVAALATPVSEHERAVAYWLDSVLAALSVSGDDSALQQIQGQPNSDGLMSMMVQIFCEEDAGFADTVIQPVYEGLMSDGEEVFWPLGWELSPELLTRFAEGIRTGNALLSQLESAFAC